MSLSAFVPENLVSRDGFGSLVPRQPAHLHTQAEFGAYLRDSSLVPRRHRFPRSEVNCIFSKTRSTGSFFIKWVEHRVVACIQCRRNVVAKDEWFNLTRFLPNFRIPCGARIAMSPR